MTSVQIASDLHIEFNESSDSPDPLKYITPVADILILAGDIGSSYRMEQLTFFLQELSRHFQVILYVPGNHEWYAIPHHEAIELVDLESRLRGLQKLVNNLYVLDRSSVRIGNTCIAGATLWSEPKCKVPPFIVRIEELHTAEYRRRHIADLEYIRRMMKYCTTNGYKLIVITHYPPSLQVVECVNKKKRFKSLYATDLEYLLCKDKVHTWVCGHIHKNFDYITEQGTRVVSNQKGKPRDRITDFSKKFVIDI
jgi:predicted phosphohydrolase